jgi:hypothetical protein
LTREISKEVLDLYLSSITANRFKVEDYCFDKQIAFKRDPARFKVAVCTRRAGKTVECAADLIETATEFRDIVCLYITLSRKSAKKIIWKDLLKILNEKKIPHKLDNTDLSITLLDTNSIIYVSGAKDKSEIEKFRGLSIKLCYIDECQSFRSYIEDMVDDVISPALFDHNGTLCLIGTPGPVPSGYFYNCFMSKAWSAHSWSLFDNPWIKKKSGKDPRILLNEELERRGVTIDDPKIQREFFAKWAVDTDALIFKYNSALNDFIIANLKRDHNWEYVIGVDIGHDDADAIAVLGWHKHRKQVYLIKEDLMPKQTITDLSEKINAFVKEFDPLRVVMDTGGLGKKIALEINRRYESMVSPAEKVRKFEYIELLNTAMRKGNFFAEKKSAFAQDCFLVEKDFDKSKVDKIVVSDRYHSDICDAVLYAYRECLHWLSVEPSKPILPNTPEYFDAEEERMIKGIEKQFTGGSDPFGENGFYSLVTYVRNLLSRLRQSLEVPELLLHS